jgi:hypothetical protein
VRRWLAADRFSVLDVLLVAVLIFTDQALRLAGWPEQYADLAVLGTALGTAAVLRGVAELGRRRRLGWPGGCAERDAPAVVGRLGRGGDRPGRPVP